jgi:hypothetical protein
VAILPTVPVRGIAAHAALASVTHHTRMGRYSNCKASRKIALHQQGTTPGIAATLYASRTALTKGRVTCRIQQWVTARRLRPSDLLDALRAEMFTTDTREDGVPEAHLNQMLEGGAIRMSEGWPGFADQESAAAADA